MDMVFNSRLSKRRKEEGKGREEKGRKEGPSSLSLFHCLSRPRFSLSLLSRSFFIRMIKTL